MNDDGQNLMRGACIEIPPCMYISSLPPSECGPSFGYLESVKGFSLESIHTVDTEPLQLVIKAGGALSDLSDVLDCGL